MVRLIDTPCFGRPVELWWRKRVWQQAQEVGVRQLFGAREGEAFGQRVEQPAELDPPQQALELGIHRWRG